MNKAGHSKDCDLQAAAKNITNKPYITSSAQQPGWNQFASSVSENQLKNVAIGVVLKMPDVIHMGRERNFTNWATQCNQQVPEDPVLLDLLRSHDTELVCETLCKFVLETCNSSGQYYPPTTIRALLSEINQIFRENKAPFSSQFHNLQHTMDLVCSELHKKEI